MSEYFPMLVVVEAVGCCGEVSAIFECPSKVGTWILKSVPVIAMKERRTRSKTDLMFVSCAVLYHHLIQNLCRSEMNERKNLEFVSLIL